MADSIVNLSALQRVDPYIAEIVESATQVALYRFSPEDNEWDKTGVEGTLFVYKRSGPPVYGFIIMNRLSKINQIEPITKELELQREDPYLLYRNSKLNIFGIWFYDKNDCSKISNITTMMLQKEKEKVGGLQRMRRASESDTAVYDQSSTAERATPKNVNILSMLSKAQEAYSKNNEVQVDKSANEPKSMVENPNASVNLVRPKAVRAGGTPEAPAQLLQPEKLSVEALFAIASQGKIASALSASPVPPPTQISSLVPGNQLLQHIMSNPENLVDHIERRQRSEQPTTTISAESLEKELKEKLKLNIPASDLESNLKFIASCEPVDQGLAVELLSSIHALTTTPLKSAPILTPAMLEKSVPTAVATSTPNPFKFATPTGPPQAPPISLMSPMMFMTKPIPPLQSLMQLATEISPVSPSTPPPRPAVTALQQNGSRGTKTNVNMRDPSSYTTELSPLTKEQFTRAIICLLQNDVEFVSKLHDAYVKTVQKMTISRP